MPSEKSCYLERNRGPAMPLTMNELRERLPVLGANHLAELLWVRSQEDDVLTKALAASICLRTSMGDWEKAKGAVEFALHFPDYVRYTEGGHGLILDEITAALQAVIDNGDREFGLRVAQYALKCAQTVAENFEEDWDWTCSIGGLEKWIEKARGG